MQNNFSTDVPANMAETKLLEAIVETLTRPINEKPLSSLIFFAACLGTGLLVRPYLPDKPEAFVLALVTLLLAVPVGGIIASLHRLLVLRDQASRLTDPAVLEGIKRSFVGRDEDVEELGKLIVSSYQVWINGDSGVGKSMLLQKAILPLFESRKITAIYLNSWRGHWEDGPAAAVLAKLNRSTAGDVMEALTLALRSLSGAVVILDQFDEFQIEHRDRFILGRGRVITRAQLEADNRFFRVLNSAVRERRLRCVFVTRRDVEWAKRGVLFEEADEFFLRRLAKGVVESEIGNIVRSDAVLNPSGGWSELREQLCDDLADDGILPVQMRFAVLGLEELRHNLTKSAYLRAGGVNGLISRYLEREVKRVSGDGSLAARLFLLLDRMVTTDGKSTSPVYELDLLAATAQDRRSGFLDALHELERRDIVRRILSVDGSVQWRLDHDYLAGPVREIIRRQLPEQAELKARYSRYAACVWWRKPLQLAGPATIANMLRARCFRGLRWGPATGWILFSVSLLLLLSAGLIYLVFDTAARASGEQSGREIFSVFGEGVSGSLNLRLSLFSRWLFDSQVGTTEPEARALVQLAGANSYARVAFLKMGLQSDSNARRIRSHAAGIAIALSGTDSGRALKLYQSTIRPVLFETKTEPDVLSAAFSLVQDWAIPSLLDKAEDEQLAARLVEKMGTDKDPQSLAALASGLNSVTKKLSREKSEELAGQLVVRVGGEKQRSALDSLSSGLSALEDKLGSEKCEFVAAKLVDRMTAEPVQAAIGLASALKALTEKVGPEKAGQMAARVVERIQNEGEPDALQVLAATLASLARKAGPAPFAAAAEKLVDRMMAENTSDGMKTLASALNSLKGNLVPGKCGPMAGRLVDKMSTEIRPARLSALASGLQSLKGKLGAEEVKPLAGSLVTRMVHEKDPDALQALASGLASMGEVVSAEKLDKAAGILVERMLSVRESTQVTKLTSALDSLKGRLGTQESDQLASNLTSRMAVERDSAVLLELASGLRSLSAQIGQKRSEKISDTLAGRMGSEKDAKVLQGLASGLLALREKLGPEQSERVAGKLVTRIEVEKDDDSLRALVSALGVAVRAGSVKSRQISKVLLQRIRAEHNATTLNALARGMGYVKENLEPEEIGLAADALVELSAVRIGSGALGTLASRIRSVEADQLAEKLVGRIAAESDSRSRTEMASAVRLLKDKIRPETASHAAEITVKRIARENDPATLRDLAAVLESLPEGSLNQSELATIAPIFRIAEAPCAVLLQINRETRLHDVVEQLGNPVCDSTDRKKMVLAVAELTGRPVATGDRAEPDKIRVDFVRLSDYLSGERPEYRRLRIMWWQIASALLLIGGVVAFVFGLGKS